MTLDPDNNSVTSAGAERRSAVRSAIHRLAKFSARAGKGFLRDAAVVDISREGLQLQTYDAPPPGTFVELEIQPRAADPRAQVTMVRGRVVRTTPLDNGLVAAGVRFHMAPLEPPAPLAQKATDADIPAEDAAAIDAVAPVPDAPGATALESAPVNRTTSPLRRHWRKAAAVALAVLLALLWWDSTNSGDRWAKADANTPTQKQQRGASPSAVVLGPNGPTTTARPRGQKMPAPPAPILSGHGPSLAGATPLPPAPSRPAAAMPSTPSQTAPAPLNAATVAPPPAPMASPVPVAASVSASPPEATELTDAERLLARVDRAQLALALGKKEEARRLLNGVAEIAVDAPDVWRKYAVVLASSLSDPASKPTDLPLFEDAVMLKADESPAASHDGIWLDVNKTDFVLTVMNNGRPLRRFPVGLGKGNTTPSGDYRIANKLTNPDWYNRGETVPAGDPRNPLGKHWMGLGNERGVPTAYGIHSISQTSDLGQPVGRGCIRMIPSDAEALFRLCPIGTPVHIHP